VPQPTRSGRADVALRRVTRGGDRRLGGIGEGIGRDDRQAAFRDDVAPGLDIGPSKVISVPVNRTRSVTAKTDAASTVLALAENLPKIVDRSSIAAVQDVE
jgi:hypothetical protein